MGDLQADVESVETPGVKAALQAAGEEEVSVRYGVRIASWSTCDPDQPTIPQITELMGSVKADASLQMDAVDSSHQVLTVPLPLMSIGPLGVMWKACSTSCLVESLI